MIRDGSVIYGNNNEGMKRVRTFKDGKLKISEDGLLQHDEKCIPISGDVRNCWAGYSLLQALFVKEHNAICDMLKVRMLICFQLISTILFPMVKVDAYVLEWFRHLISLRKMAFSIFDFVIFNHTN